MKTIKGFQEFLLENAIENGFSVKKFISDIEKEMGWNGYDDGVKVSLLDSNEIIPERSKTPAQIFPKCNIFFLYVGAPGQSVKKDIEKACKDQGYDTAKVGIIDNYSRHEDHQYLIALSVSPTLVTSLKFGL